MFNFLFVWPSNTTQVSNVALWKNELPSSALKCVMVLSSALFFNVHICSFKFISHLLKVLPKRILSHFTFPVFVLYTCLLLILPVLCI